MPSTIRHEADTFVDAQGVTIHYLRWRAPHPRGVIQLLHGVGEYAARYDELASALASHGYTVYANDHRGHGETWREQWAGDASKIGRLGAGGVRAVIAGLRRFTGVIKAQEPHLPLILLGHSLGSLFAQKLIDEDARDWDAVVLSGTAYRTLSDMNGGDLNKRFADTGPTTAEWLSRDRAIVQAFAEDPLTSDKTVLSLFGLPDTLRLLGTPKHLLRRRIPMLIQIGEEDTLGGPTSVEKLAVAYRERGGLSDVTVVIYPGARHEVYNETNRVEVRGDLMVWLDARFPRRRRPRPVDPT